MMVESPPLNWTSPAPFIRCWCPFYCWICYCRLLWNWKFC